MNPQDSRQDEDEKNTVKRIRTKGGHEIIFVEEEDEERLEIHTPKNLKISLEDEQQMIIVQDKDGRNMLEIDGKNGKILVTAENSISFHVAGGRAALELGNQEGGKVTLKADTISLESRQALQINSAVTTALTSGASMKIESAGILELKGAMIKMN
ncbi:hypothetical protein KL86SPO_20510 [uncultured Sporomusa sp.]|uniref:DUF2345 domain-containing protein n=1 Tax=uncultured Sporomusa sp. TaxID=307249 RepID=A0A212LPH8_9FIRM|nr:hypothetical protein [uncultured Sporomusa sp.]SCM79319.1 hypothetical protein KL86SPO_20510 [uncultured Sporomusa sp.]